MQSFQGLSANDFKNKAKEVVSKFEIYIDPNWINLSNLGANNDNYLIEAHYSSAQRNLGHEPTAAEIEVVIDDTDGDFHPQNPGGAYNTYFKAGRQIRFSTGFMNNNTAYYWQWFTGIVSGVDIDRQGRRLVIHGSDMTQRLQEKSLTSPDTYWGDVVTRSTVANQQDYETDANCNGIYIAYLDGEPIYDTDSWVYDKTTKKLFFLPSQIPANNGNNNLDIYYYTTQKPEVVVNDLLMAAGVYANLENGDFENWANGANAAPDGWALSGANAIVERSATAKLGIYSVKVTRAGTDCFLHQNIHAEKGIDYWKARTVSFSCWAWASTANTTRLQLYDGIGGTGSSYHAGNSGWQLLTATRTIDANANMVRLGLQILNANTLSRFDGAAPVEGNYTLPYPDYTPSNATIERIRFEAGSSALNAMQKICERVDYEFYFKYDGTPVFKPLPTEGASNFDFSENLISTFDYLENIDEVRNHIIVEGEEYTIYDELWRVLNGAELMYTLDNIPDGNNYGKVALTSIGAGKIIVAGLDANVTDRMFSDPQAQDNIEAWRHANDVTLIDGGDIYANSITANQIGANAITANKIAANAVTATKISVANLSAINANCGTIQAGTIGDGNNWCSTSQVMVGAVRALKYIQGSTYPGAFMGMLMCDETGFYWAGGPGNHIYPISLEEKVGGGNIYYLKIDTDVPGGGNGTNETPANGRWEDP